MAFFKKNKSLVGLDIGSSSLKAVELTKFKKSYQLSGFAYEPLSPDAVVDGAIMDSPAIAETIKKSFRAATGYTSKERPPAHRVWSAHRPLPGR